MRSAQKDRIYFETLMKLNSFIEQNIAGEGFLPSESKMCELFKVSRVTYRSALAAFQQNGFIVSYPKRGHYVQAPHYRVKKVGIVLSDGKESPFMPLGRIVSSLIETLEDRRIYSQIIQSSLPENIMWRALAHGVRALVWVQPNPSLLPMICNEAKDLPFPQLLVGPGLSSSQTGFPENVATVTTDTKDTLTRKVHYLLEHGHSAFAYMLENDITRFRGYFDTFDQDFANAHILHADDDWERLLKALVSEKRITAILVSGSLKKQEQVMRILDSSLGGHDVFVYLPSSHLVNYFTENYPQVNIIANSELDWRKLGAAAAGELVDYIYSNRPVESREICCHRVVPFSQ